MKFRKHRERANLRLHDLLMLISSVSLKYIDLLPGFSKTRGSILQGHPMDLNGSN